MKKILFQSFLSFAILSISISSQAQILPNFGGQRAGLSALSFLKNDMNPISLGMAGASLALAGNTYSIASNPAGLTDIDDHSFAMTHMLFGAGIHQSLISGQFKLKSSAVTGFTINSMNSGWMEERTEFQPDGTGLKFSVSQTAFGYNYAQKLSDMFSLGVQLKYIYEQIDQYRNHTAAIDVGFLYSTDFKDLRFAVLFQNFGGNSELNGEGKIVDFNRGQDLELSSYNLPTVFKMGLSFTALEKDDHALVFSGELNNPNDNAENLRFGLQYKFKDLMSIQTGYKFSVLGQSYPSFGFEYKSRIGVHPMYLTYGANPTNFMGTQHLFGIRMVRNKMER